LPDSTPAAIVEQGTTVHQRVATGALCTLPELASRSGMKPPCLIVIGSVVSLHERLSWFAPETESAALSPVQGVG